MGERESVVVCIDNSEWMRNGDLSPTRLQSQQEAVNLIMQCKLRANPENGVGLLAMADQVEVLSTMTREERKLYIKLHEIQIKGSAQIINAIKVSHLALRHRQNRNQKMRIVMFIGSPIEDIDKAEFIKLAKKLKKEKVSADFICFGEATNEVETQVLSDFIDTLNGKDNTTSSILVVPGGSKLIEALVTSPICRGEGGNMAMIGSGGGVEFGIDPDEDPELALALRVSLEEQRQRQRQEAGAEAGAEDNAMDAQPAEIPAAAPVEPDFSAMTEEEQLEWALRMSMAETADEPKQGEAPATSSNDAKKDEQAMEVDPNIGQLIEDPELLQQLVEGMADESTETAKQKTDKESDSKGKPDKKS